MARRQIPKARLLKPWARAVVTVWVLVTVPLLLFSMVTMVLTLPRVLGTAWDNGLKQQAMLSHSLAAGDLADAAVRVLAIACLALPVLGIFYILLRLVRQLATGLWQKTRGKALQRGTAIAAIAAVAAGLAWAWWPGAETYRPVQPYERGTLADATTAVFPAVRRVPDGRGPAGQDRCPVAGGRPEAHPRGPAAEHGPGAAGSPAHGRHRHGRHRGGAGCPVVGLPLRQAGRSRGRRQPVARGQHH